MLVLIRGAGDLASGVSLRLHRAGFPVVMTDLPKPTAIRRTVCFSQAIRFGTTMVEDAEGVCCHTAREVKAALDAEKIPVLPDETAKCKDWLHPDVLVDGILAKKNLGTKMSDAPLVIALGPGFCAGRDCHAVIETMRGHSLGRIIREGSAMPNTGVPGIIAGYGKERVVHAPADGTLHILHDIGDSVEKGEPLGLIGEVKVPSPLSGLLRGILPDGFAVTKGLKMADVDPRLSEYANCFTISDKARCIGGGVLEGLLSLMREGEA